MDALIAVLPGDGIGPEVTAEAQRVLARIAERDGHRFTFEPAAIGGCAIDATGAALPAATLALCRRADAVLLGAVGGPQWDDPAAPVRPEDGLLAIRKELGLFANLRPVRSEPSLRGGSPLRPELLDGVDVLVVRELTGGLYFGRKEEAADRAADVCEYSVPEIERVVRVAARAAQGRRGKLTSVDKANVLVTSRLWRATTTRLLAAEFPDLETEHLLVDAAAMHLLQRPADFDVIVTGNLFGDILTDEASVLAGALGFLPSASLGGSGGGLYEPVHGSAPDIAGRGIANPYGAIASAAMLLRHALGLESAAHDVEAAIAGALAAGALTADAKNVPGTRVGTRDAGDAVIERLS